MANCLYGLKLFLFRKSVEMTPTERKNLQRFAVWISLVYAYVWFIAPEAREAVNADLWFYQTMLTYKDKIISAVAIEKFLRHTW